MPWPTTDAFRMLPLDGYDAAARAVPPRAVQTCGWREDHAASTGHNIYFSHLLAAINERREAIRSYMPPYWQGAQIAQAEWNNIWSPLSWSYLRSDSSITLFDNFRRAIVRPELPADLTKDSSYIGLMHSCTMKDTSPTPVVLLPAPMSSTNSLCAKGRTYASTVKQRYAKDGEEWRGLFGPYVDADGANVTGWYIGKNVAGDAVYAADFATGYPRLGDAPFILTAQHFNELVMAINLCHDLYVRWVAREYVEDLSSSGATHEVAYAGLNFTTHAPEGVGNVLNGDFYMHHYAVQPLGADAVASAYYYRPEAGVAPSMTVVALRTVEGDDPNTPVFSKRFKYTWAVWAQKPPWADIAIIPGLTAYYDHFAVEALTMPMPYDYNDEPALNFG